MDFPSKVELFVSHLKEHTKEQDTSLNLLQVLDLTENVISTMKTLCIFRLVFLRNHVVLDLLGMEALFL